MDKQDVAVDAVATDIRPTAENGPTPGQGIIPPELGEVLRSAGIDTLDPHVTRAIEISMMRFSGALPMMPPFILAEYEAQFPGIGERFITWTESQRDHRQRLERLRSEGSETRMNRAQLGTLTVAIGGLCLAAAVGIFGNPWVAAVIAIVAVGGPAAAHVLADRTASPWSAPTSAGRRDAGASREDGRS